MSSWLENISMILIFIFCTQIKNIKIIIKYIDREKNSDKTFI